MDQYKLIKDIEIPAEIPTDQKVDFEVFQRAMADLEEDFLRTKSGNNPNLKSVQLVNEERAQKARKELTEERDMKLASADTVYDEELKGLDRKYENAKKSLFERILTSISRCDSSITPELTNIFPEKKNKIELDLPRYPHDSQIMAKVIHTNTKPISIAIADRDNDFLAMKAELTIKNHNEGVAKENGK